MRKIELNYKVSGMSFAPANSESMKALIGFKMQCQSDKVKNVRATYEFISEAEAELDQARSSWFAYLKTVLTNGHELFSQGVPGQSRRRKVDSLDYIMRLKYCEQHTEFFKVFQCAMPGEKEVKLRREVFSLSRASFHLGKDDFIRCIKDMREALYNAHFDFTRQFGEPWSVPHWIE